MTNLIDDMRRARNASRNKAAALAVDLTSRLLSLPSEDELWSPHHADALSDVRRLLAELSQRGYEMNAYSNSLETVTKKGVI